MARATALKESAPPRPRHERHRPEQTLLYRIIDRHYPEFLACMAEQGKPLPLHIKKEFDEFLKCGRLEHGFLRVRCETCHEERLVAFSCKRRGFCPSCGARRMAESAALLVDEVLPHQPMRQWVLSFPYQLRFLFASRPELMGNVLGSVYRAIASYLIKKAGLTRKSAQCGAVTLIQRFGRSGAPGALNLNPHAARSTSICCSWMAFTQKTNRARSSSNAPKRLFRKNSPYSSTLSATA
jgi:ribosomal protein S27E